MQPLQFYTAATPNGWSVSIALEELKKVNPELKWEDKAIDIGKNTQKEDWFLKISE
jgi:glutathione S-transferase